MENIVTDNLCLESRKRLSMSGVESVDGFSENYLKLTVNKTKVYISGQNIRITAFNKGTGNLSADGEFCEIKYGGKKQPLMKKIFK